MCRSFLGTWRNANNEEQFLGRMNLGVMSISLPMIAYESTDEEQFFEKLEHYLNIAYAAHKIRIEKLAKTKAEQNPIMFVNGVISRLDPKDEIRPLLFGRRSSASIGYVGLSECVEKFKGSYDKEFGMDILKFIKEKCNEYSNELDVAFSPYGTPAESLCYKFAKAINKKYNNILGRDYITNSFHHPVHEDISIFSKWDFESGFADISTGGNISYIETPSLKNNLKALEKIVDYAYTRVPYFGINQPVDRCNECKFEGEFHAEQDGFTCPSCGNKNPEKMECIRRVSGYLGAAARPFNRGKQQECINRLKHNK